MKVKRYLLVVLVFMMVCMMNYGQTKAANETPKEYHIKINKGTNVVTVYDKATGKPVKAFVCSVGNATPIGTFKTSDKYRWHLLVGPSYGQYCTRITGRILFHSVWYHKNMNYASQSYIQYRRLGTVASHGCVRLTVADSKWIYDNCVKGTTVTIFKGTAKNDPLGKPVPPPVLGGNRGWDPTDPNPNNPYLQMIPIVHMKYPVRSVETNVEYDLKYGVVARRANGEYISWSTKVYVCEPGSTVRKPVSTGKYIFKKPGVYKVFYKAQDPLNKKTRTVMATFKVMDLGMPLIKGTHSRTIKVRTTQFLLHSITASTASGIDFTGVIKLYIKRPGSNVYERSYTGKYVFDKPGTYSIKYEVRSPINGKVATVIVQRKVVWQL